MLENQPLIGSELVMTLAEQLRQERRLEGQLSMVISIIKATEMSLTQIMEMTGLPPHIKEQLEKELRQQNISYRV